VDIWFTSDWHLGHKNIIDHCNRPFKTTGEMDDFILTRYVETVKGTNDIVYHLGDLVWRENTIDDYFLQLYTRKMKGRIILIPGNHDEKLKAKLRPHVEITERLFHLKLNHRWFILCHYPLELWYKHLYGALHFHGHTHGISSYRKNRVDVGFDVWQRPVNLEELIMEVERI